MARLPQPGGDNGNWGDILNDYLSQSLKPDGTLQDNTVTANTLAPNSVTNAALANDAVNASIIADGSITNAQIADTTIQESKLATAVQSKLNAASGSTDWNDITNKPTIIAAGADQAAARSAIGAGTSNLTLGTNSSTAKAGDYQPTAANISDSTAVGRSLLTAASVAAVKTTLSLTKSDVGLSNVDNTSDATKNSAAVTLTNKTLTDPKLNAIKDTNNNTILDLAPTANADSYIGIKNTNWQQATLFSSSPTHANVDLVLEPRGTGQIILYSSQPTFSVDGPDANVDLNLYSKGTGVVKVNDQPILTGLEGDYSKLVATTAAGSTGAENGANTWAKIVTFSTGTNEYAEAQLLLSITNDSSGNHDTAVVSVFFRTNATGADPNVDVQIVSKGGDGYGIVSDSFKVVSGGWSSDMELWIKKGAPHCRFSIYETSKSTAGGTLTYATNSPWQSATPVGAVNNASSNGVFSGLPLTVNGRTSMSGINDTNGNPSLDLGAIPNAVNRIYIDNQSTGNYPTLGATGPDTNIGIALAPKNDGPINVFGNAPTIAAAGGANGGNLNLNLKSQGTGTVQANGVRVTTSKMRHPYYVDQTRFEPWPQILCNGGNWSLLSGDLPLTFFIPDVNMTVSNIITMGWNDTSHTGATLCKLAIYRVDDVYSGGNKMECIARSGHKADRWNTTAVDTAPIVDDGASSPNAISSVVLTAGQQYAVGYMSIGHTGTPKLAALGTFRSNTMLPHVGFFGGGGYSDMPVHVSTGWLEEWTYIWFALT